MTNGMPVCFFAVLRLRIAVQTCRTFDGQLLYTKMPL